MSKNSLMDIFEGSFYVFVLNLVLKNLILPKVEILFIVLCHYNRNFLETKTGYVAHDMVQCIVLISLLCF